VLTQVTQARANAVAAGAQGPQQAAAAENALTGALRSLFAVVENYPDLKANQNFLALQGELTNTEDRLQTSRRFYNANVRDYNQRVQQFPSRLIAGTFGFKEEEYFEVEEALREAGAPQVNFTQPGPSVSLGAPGTAHSERWPAPGETGRASEPVAAPPPPTDAPPPPPPPPSAEGS